jgi:hypothetical protein
VEDLVSSLETSYENRHEKPISVCLTEPPSKELEETLKNSTSYLHLESATCGIDGQHRGAGLMRLNDEVLGPEKKKDYWWLAVIYSHGTSAMA